MRVLDGSGRCISRAGTLEAARWFERNRAACGPPGLLTEEFDVGQRQLRGNLPQAFVHALLLECPRLADPWSGGRRRLRYPPPNQRRNR